jgi:dUTP pyrophosphatase
VRLEIQLLDEGLPMPEGSYEDDAGIDLRARIDVTLTSVVGPKTIPTGVAVAIPRGHLGLICSRSGLAASHGIAVLNAPGIVDAGYRGELNVVLFSVRERAATLRRGSRIAQLVIVPAAGLEMVPVQALSKTARGGRGLGSTGL